MHPYIKRTTTIKAVEIMKAQIILITADIAAICRLLELFTPYYHRLGHVWFNEKR